MRSASAISSGWRRTLIPDRTALFETDGSALRTIHRRRGCPRGGVPGAVSPVFESASRSEDGSMRAIGVAPPGMSSSLPLGEWSSDHAVKPFIRLLARAMGFFMSLGSGWRPASSRGLAGSCRAPGSTTSPVASARRAPRCGRCRAPRRRPLPHARRSCRGPASARRRRRRRLARSSSPTGWVHASAWPVSAGRSSIGFQSSTNRLTSAVCTGVKPIAARR